MSWIRELPHKVLQATHGRTTGFFIAFFAAGNVLAFLNRLTPVYVGYMATLGGLVLGHSIKEDVVAMKNGPPQKGGYDADHPDQA